MPTKPKSPRQTIRTRRRLPKVGDEIMMRVKVVRIGEGDDPDITVLIPANGQRSTAPAKYMLPEDED